MNIHEIYHLCLSTAGFLFIATTCSAKLIHFIKLKLMDSKKQKEAIAKERRKEMYLLLKAEFDTKEAEKEIGDK